MPAPEPNGFIKTHNNMGFMTSTVAGLRKTFSWLKPGGKLIVVAETPYLRNFQSFIPIYENQKAAGMLWLGFVEDVMQIAPKRGAALPKTMHFLDPEVLQRVALQVGFVVEKCNTFARPEFPEDIRFDGRESVGMIARKPWL